MGRFGRTVALGTMVKIEKWMSKGQNQPNGRNWSKNIPFDTTTIRVNFQDDRG
jgi:hypothetical protein